MKLFVANTTKQDHEFVYRIPESTRLHQQPVPSGQQVQIYRDDTSDIIGEIVKQHERYGLTRIDEIDRAKPFIGMCYSIDREIPVSKIMYAAEHNDDVLSEQGQAGRVNAVAALGETLSRASSGNLGKLEVEVVESKKPGDTTKGFRQTIEVPRKTDAKTRRGGRRPKGA